MLDCEILLLFAFIILVIILSQKNENFTNIEEKYELYKAGSIINPKNSIYYIDTNNELLEKGEYHIRMFNKTNHDIVNSLVGKYVIKLDLSKNCKTCRLSHPYQELVYIRKANNEWHVFNYKGELYKISDKNMCMYLDEKLSNLLYKENFTNLENTKIFFPTYIFTFNNLNIHFTLDKNKNGNYNIEITDDKDNVFPDYYENGIVFLLHNDILYLKKISGDWLYLHLEHPDIYMKYTLPSKYVELDNILEEKLEEINKKKENFINSDNNNDKIVEPFYPNFNFSYFKPNLEQYNNEFKASIAKVGAVLKPLDMNQYGFSSDYVMKPKEFDALQVQQGLVDKPADMPPLYTLAQMAKACYYVSKEIADYTILEQNPFMIFYQKDGTNLIIVAIRGTEFRDLKDVLADVSIVNNDLSNSSRYRQDLFTLQAFQLKYPLSQYRYYGVGHSLSGAILDKFLNDGLVKNGVSFNPAVEKQDYARQNGNHRIYLSCDPLYNIMGKFITNGNIEVLPMENSAGTNAGMIDSAKGASECHSINTIMSKMYDRYDRRG